MTTVAAGVSAEAAAAGQQTATTDDYTWLRGVQQTDEDGMVEFDTIVPGWYSGRTAHIHVKVRPCNDCCQSGHKFASNCMWMMHSCHAHD